MFAFFTHIATTRARVLIQQIRHSRMVARLGRLSCAPWPCNPSREIVLSVARLGRLKRAPWQCNVLSEQSIYKYIYIDESEMTHPALALDQDRKPIVSRGPRV